MKQERVLINTGIGELIKKADSMLMIKRTRSAELFMAAVTGLKRTGSLQT